MHIDIVHSSHSETLRGATGSDILFNRILQNIAFGFAISGPEFRQKCRLLCNKTKSLLIELKDDGNYL